jgi:hypothetical protein
MKKFLITLLFLSSLFSYPYKPKPILFVHGRSGDQQTWGIRRHKDRNPNDIIIKDSIIQGGTFDVFLQKMIPYCVVWDSIDSSYTSPTNPKDTAIFLNKSFLEIWNADYPLGSIDEEGAGLPPPFSNFYFKNFFILLRIKNL